MTAFVYARILKLLLEYTIDGNAMSCGLHYAADADLDFDDPETFRLAWETACLAAFQDCVGGTVEFTRIYCYGIKPAQVRTAQDQLNAKTGNAIGGAIASDLAAVFQIRQYDVSSRINGRIFLSGLTEAQVVDGKIDPASLTDPFQTLGTLLLSPITIGSGTTFKLVCLHRPTGSPPPDPIGYTAIAVTPQASVGTQRRRRTELQSYA